MSARALPTSDRRPPRTRSPVPCRWRAGSWRSAGNCIPGGRTHRPPPLSAAAESRAGDPLRSAALRESSPIARLKVGGEPRRLCWQVAGRIKIVEPAQRPPPEASSEGVWPSASEARRWGGASRPSAVPRQETAPDWTRTLDERGRADTKDRSRARCSVNAAGGPREEQTRGAAARAARHRSTRGRGHHRIKTNESLLGRKASAGSSAGGSQTTSARGNSTAAAPPNPPEAPAGPRHENHSRRRPQARAAARTNPAAQ